ncbi:uncharacterized protein LOC144419858 isoform X2 [Styela clava]
MNAMSNAIWIFTRISSLLSTIQSENSKHTATFRLYKFELFDQGKEWYAAKKVCTDRDSWLVEINDLETYEAVRNLTREDIWIGLNFLPKYKWLWNEEGELRFSKWDSTSPKKYETKFNNQCVRQFASTGLWRNHDCKPGYKYVCQSDLITISTTPTTRSLKSGESIDVKLHITSYDGNVNVDVRNQDNGKIKTVTTSNISSSNPSTTLTINIGPIEVSSTTISYKFEARPQGNNHQLYSRIVTLKLVVSDKCDSKPCMDRENCKFTLKAPYYKCSCQPAYTGSNCEGRRFINNTANTCKYHVNLHDEKAFADSNSTCRELGGEVAMMKTTIIQDLVGSQIISQYGTNGTTIEFWIGGYKVNDSWIWVDGTAVSISEENSKLPGALDGKTRIMFLSSYLNGERNSMRWFATDKNVKIGYICEIAVIDVCSPSPCMYSGTCVFVGCQKICKCLKGFDGKYCEIGINSTIVISVTCVGIGIAVALIAFWIIRKMRNRNVETQSKQRSNDISIASPYQTTFVSSPSCSKPNELESPYTYDNDTTCYQEPTPTINETDNTVKTYENINS